MDSAIKLRTFSDPYIDRQIEDLVSLLNQAKAELASISASVGGAEPALGNPTADGQLLSSSASGERSWVDLPAAVPVGAYISYAGSTAPDGWLLCYGQPVSRTTYADLFAAIGTAFGAGDGSTTFNVPDMRGRVPAGLDNMGGAAAGVLSGASSMGATQGAETHTLSVNEMPAHDHGSASSLVQSYYGVKYVVQEEGTDYLMVSGSHTHDSAGGGQAHNNVQPTMAANFIIKC